MLSACVTSSDGCILSMPNVTVKGKEMRLVCVLSVVNFWVNILNLRARTAGAKTRGERNKMGRGLHALPAPASVF